MSRCLLSCLIIFFVASGAVRAQEQPKTNSPIYQVTDQSGRFIYTDQPSSETYESVTLPSIQKENLDEKIDTIRRQTPPSCSGHGGISCSLGADDDGSVVCLDGYRDASPNFRTLCSKAKLKILSLYLRGEDGKVHDFNERLPLQAQINKNKATVLLVSIYNAAEIPAQKMEVKLRQRRLDYIFANGQQSIGPYESEEYSFLVTDLLSISRITHLTRGMIYLNCENCQ